MAGIGALHVPPSASRPFPMATVCGYALSSLQTEIRNRNTTMRPQIISTCKSTLRCVPSSVCSAHRRPNRPTIDWARLLQWNRLHNTCRSLQMRPIEGRCAITGPPRNGRLLEIKKFVPVTPSALKACRKTTANTSGTCKPACLLILRPNNHPDINNLAYDVEKCVYCFV